LWKKAYIGKARADGQFRDSLAIRATDTPRTFSVLSWSGGMAGLQQALQGAQP